MKKRTIWIVCAVSVVVLLGIIAAVICWHFSQTPNSSGQNTNENQSVSADVRDTLGVTISSSELLRYLENTAESNLEDEFSKIYSEAVQIKVSALDEESKTATIEVSAPPLRAIFEESVPTETSGDFDVVFDQYMADVQDAILGCPSERMVTSTVICSVVGENDLKIVPNNDLFDAMFPDIQALLGEVLVQMLVGQEE